MRELGSCVSPISGEHLISESVIEVLKGDGGFSISGVPWLAKGEEKILSKKSLRANCLCTKHNSVLSPIDNAAKHLFRCLKVFLEGDAGQPRHALVSGHDIERWLLKTAKALAVSGNLVRDDKRLSGAFAKDVSLVAMLDDPTAWPEGAGLYCMMNEGDLMVNHSRFQLVPWVETAEDGDEIVAVQVSVLGFIFVLLLEQVDDEKYPLLARAQYRPGRIEIQHPKSVSWVTISWEDNAFHATLKVQHVKQVAADDGSTKTG
ncbi:hypothetical protein BV98_002977 [Sphingobium herbicidovorans NBRC 16415]|uniref:Uncharacterized protein n=1 Tax=Sphingobium herbicidovorans (strain ATCC 700291 / DSM 11019 / CCUG 56400 / KCTC 2939 / LMG 18315 / NBRC 16415 / MH) TaxID=1219045 RepID=A0A086P6Y2_SPHHM|nr:hypothetical protein [Sphingobium herbicidovorans]KFG89150.1 hypothetical protein BV98_002977 [Sphingobium herbicidovorans NBRC 16415]